MAQSRSKLKGAPPKHLTGKMPVSSMESPWWDQVLSEITGPSGLVGSTLSVEELTELIPSYPDGRRPRARAVVRRLRSVLELVSRGPNGSLGRGATYRVLPALPKPRAPAADDDVLALNEDYIAAAVERMTGGKR